MPGDWTFARENREGGGGGVGGEGASGSTFVARVQSRVSGTLDPARR